MDQTSAQTYVGKHLLIGMTYLDHDESVLEQKQFYGTIVRVNGVEGIVAKLHNSEDEFRLPPDLNSFQEAAKGEYRLRSTGEVIVDPDLLATWTLTKPPPNGIETGPKHERTLNRRAPGAAPPNKALQLTAIACFSSSVVPSA